MLLLLKNGVLLLLKILMGGVAFNNPYSNALSQSIIVNGIKMVNTNLYWLPTTCLSASPIPRPLC